MKVTTRSELLTRSFGYDPIQKSFVAPKYVIKAKHLRLQKITVVEHGFFFPGGSSAQ